jgi:hypothetical protein
MAVMVAVLLLVVIFIEVLEAVGQERQVVPLQVQTRDPMEQVEQVQKIQLLALLFFTQEEAVVLQAEELLMVNKALIQQVAMAVEETECVLKLIKVKMEQPILVAAVVEELI